MSKKSAPAASEVTGGQGVRASSVVRRRRNLLLAVVVGSLVLGSTGVAASYFVKSPTQVVADSTAPPLGKLTTPVEHRVLTREVVLRGVVTAGKSFDVTVGAGGGDEAARSIVTKLPLSQGSTVQAGKVLAEVSGRPVIALRGKLPAYRDLRPGAHGDDVAQLQEALAQLGKPTGSDSKGSYGPGTRAAVEALYASLGYDPLPAIADGADGVTSARTALRNAERAWEDAAAGKEKSRAAEDLADARSAWRAAEAAHGPMVPLTEIMFLPDFPARVDSVTARAGDETSGQIMTVSTGDLLIEGGVPAQEKGLLRPGQKVTYLSEMTGDQGTAKVISVAQDPYAAPAQEDDAPAPGSAVTPGDYRVLVAPQKKLGAHDVGLNVRLTVQAASTKEKVLVVPTSAVSARRDGSTTVTVADSGNLLRRVQVRVGMAGDGYVEVVPIDGELIAGADVVIGQQGTRSGEQS